MSETIQQSYTDLVEVMRGIGAALIPANAARYEAPPRARKTKEAVSESKGIPNPTLDVVLDARRSALSDEITSTARTLRHATALLKPHINELRRAVARWEGQEGDATA